MGRLSGYVRTGVTHPEEAPLLREAVTLLFDGKTEAEATRWLASRGMLTPRGNTFRREVLHRLLANPRLAGLDESGKPIEGWDERVLEPDVFHRLQKLFEERSEKRGKSRDAHHYLVTGGCALCDECAHSMVGSRAHAEAPPSYKCDDCGKTRINADRLEDFVVEHVLAELLKPGARQRLEKLECDIEAEVARLKEHIEGAAERDASIGDLYGRGLIVKAAFLAAQKASKEDVRVSKLRLKQLEQMTDLPIGDVHDLVAWWRTASHAAKKGLVLLEVEHVRVGRAQGSQDPEKRVLIDWRQPTS
ncbi:recombinase family protein [Streptomyces yunnanensis]|uniref:Recombinase n=1 Tax=Streptomyces yunnanensis TaxID=156453 RepID=A0A9X8QVW1_9ACTN|nr:recombinase family protein [Streptomyces yunnanensis]SHM51663.1 Recombinase [Streptomyces yunnanensis]